MHVYREIVIECKCIHESWMQDMILWSQSNYFVDSLYMRVENKHLWCVLD